MTFPIAVQFYISSFEVPESSFTTSGGATRTGTRIGAWEDDEAPTVLGARFFLGTCAASFSKWWDSRVGDPRGCLNQS